jgi:DNA gyrase subunit A
MGRNTQGVRVINIDEGDTVVAAVKVVDRDDDKEHPEAEDATEEMSAIEGGGEEGTDEEPVH